MTLQTESAEIAMWKIAPDFLWLWLLTRWGLTGIHNWSMSTLPAIPARISNGLCFGLRTICGPLVWCIFDSSRFWMASASSCFWHECFLASACWRDTSVSGNPWNPTFLHFPKDFVIPTHHRWCRLYDCRSRACSGTNRLWVSGVILVYVMGHYPDHLFLGPDYC